MSGQLDRSRRLLIKWKESRDPRLKRVRGSRNLSIALAALYMESEVAAALALAKPPSPHSPHEL
jgi:hypothetical protein